MKNEKVDLGEIVFCDLIIIHKGVKHKLNKVVYKNSGNLFYNRNYLEGLKIIEPVKVESIKIINRLGFENKEKRFTEVKRSDEKRNKTTGTYE